MNLLRTGVVGLGYVGGAIVHAIKKKNRNVATYDINKNTLPNCKSLKELVGMVEMIYICVPTPMNIDGACDTSIVQQVVREIVDVAEERKYIVIKSTIPPGTTEKLHNAAQGHYVTFSPEFLTEKNHLQDFLYPEIMLLGIPAGVSTEVGNLLLENQISLTEATREAQVVNSTEAEFYKYIANNFLALKVGFANEMEELVQHGFGCSWDRISELLKKDRRLGATHWSVPGPDGHYGWGGVCFCKDMSALRSVAVDHGIKTPILDASWERNNTMDRPEQDWRELKGRAVV